MYLVVVVVMFMVAVVVMFMYPCRPDTGLALFARVRGGLLAIPYRTVETQHGGHGNCYL